MTKEFIYSALKQHRLAVLATVGEGPRPEAAVVGISVTPELAIVFDTVRTSRKYANLITCSRVAFAIGWKNETTIQFEGEARELGASDNAYREIYYEVFPDGRERTESWPGLTHFVVLPRWIRYSCFNEPVVIDEMSF